jgi:thioredoxin 1
MANVSDVTDETFEQEVLKAGKPVVVDFWAPWCGPCRVIGPILEDLSAKHGDRIKFTKLNVDDNQGTSVRYNVLSIPTVILFEGGEPQETVIGARPRSHFEHAWARWLDEAAALPAEVVPAGDVDRLAAQ